MSIQDLPHREPPPEESAITKLGVHNSSLYHNYLYTRGKAQRQNNNHLYIRGIKAQSQTPPQSPVHKRDNHKLKAQPPLHKRDMHKIKAKERLQLGDLNRPQTIFLTKTRSYR